MRSLIRTLAVLYGLNGFFHLMSLIVLLTVADAAFFSKIFSESDEIRKLSYLLGEGFAESLWYGIVVYSAFEAITGLILLYSLWTLRAWGRYLALIYSGLWFLAFSSYILALVIAPTNIDALTAAMVLLRVATVVVCVRRDGKELLSN